MPTGLWLCTGVWIKTGLLRWCVLEVKHIYIRVFLPVCTAHHSPVLCLDKLCLVRHGSHLARSSAQSGVRNEAVCTPPLLPLVSLLVDWPPVLACRLRHLPDVKVAGALVAKLGSHAHLPCNHLDSVATVGSRGHFHVARYCDGMKLGCD